MQILDAANISAAICDRPGQFLRIRIEVSVAVCLALDSQHLPTSREVLWYSTSFSPSLRVLALRSSVRGGRPSLKQDQKCRSTNEIASSYSRIVRATSSGSGGISRRPI